MYQQHFGLRELPFNVTPDPRFLYLNDCYQEAIAALGYGIEARKGFITLVGEAGTGKTTLLRRVLDTLDPRVRTVLLLHPTVTFDEILEHVLQELGIPTDGGRKLVLLQRLGEFLLEHTHGGGNVVLLIDEAQDLAPAVLEELRLLSNLETGREKILQIVLAGQPELDAVLADPALRQLRQRVTLHVRIRPLSAVEVAAYVRVRLERAGAGDAGLFTDDALARVAQASGGIPRIVNVLCDACLVTAFAAGSRQVTGAIVEEVSADYGRGEGGPAPAPVVVQPAPPPPPPPAPLAPPAPPPEAASDAPARVPARPRWGGPMPLAGAAGLAVVLASAFYGLAGRVEREPPVPPPSVSTTVPEPPPPAEAAAPPAPETPPPPVAAASAEPPAPPPAPAPPPGPITAAEATALVDAFRAAYEARDAGALAALFADDGRVNRIHGAEAIAASYRATFAKLADVRCVVPSLRVVPHSPRVAVSAPVILRSRTGDGAWKTASGWAQWLVDRRDGAPRILALDYRLGAPAPRRRPWRPARSAREPPPHAAPGPGEE